MSVSVETLNQQFAIPDVLRFVEAAAGMPVIEITSADASARIAVQGAQVLEWQPTGQQPVLWVSRAAVYQAGKGVRGGVPVCWPWFGAGEAGKPAHGFVRTRMWQVRETGQNAEGVYVKLGISDDAETRAIWDYAFDLELIVTAGKTLSMELVTHNTGDKPFTITDALHTYFRTGDITKTEVLGLDKTAYLDKVLDFGQHMQDGAVVFTGETDRVYLDTQAECVINDGALMRKIHVAKRGSSSTVVWNPWTEKEKGFADMAVGEYREMLCVETCNAATDTVIVESAQSHHLLAQISTDGY
ncbi:MAG: D-hexose-6-phosphate mutarotase [Sulfuriferula sp.]|nr:D-hexose-6-phosphate mutarotase [Sulfuriferula sp.]